MILPRKCGGVDVLWKKNIDHLITVLPDGGERIQCVLLKSDRPMLIVSVYMLCKGATYNFAEYSDCMDQLNEILSKYKETHDFVIGGDFNETYHTDGSASRRSKYLSELVSDYRLNTQTTGMTFRHPNGSSIIYFYSKTLEHHVSKLELLNELIENNSDHYPLKCRVNEINRLPAKNDPAPPPREFCRHSLS